MAYPIGFPVVAVIHYIFAGISYLRISRKGGSVWFSFDLDDIEILLQHSRGIINETCEPGESIETVIREGYVYII